MTVEFVMNKRLVHTPAKAVQSLYPSPNLTLEVWNVSRKQLRPAHGEVLEVPHTPVSAYAPCCLALVSHQQPECKYAALFAKIAECVVEEVHTDGRRLVVPRCASFFSGQGRAALIVF